MSGAISDAAILVKNIWEATDTIAQVYKDFVELKVAYYSVKEQLFAASFSHRLFMAVSNSERMINLLETLNAQQMALDSLKLDEFIARLEAQYGSPADTIQSPSDNLPAAGVGRLVDPTKESDQKANEDDELNRDRVKHPLDHISAVLDVKTWTGASSNLVSYLGDTYGRALSDPITTFAYAASDKQKISQALGDLQIIEKELTFWFEILDPEPGEMGDDVGTDLPQAVVIQPSTVDGETIVKGKPSLLSRVKNATLYSKGKFGEDFVYGTFEPIIGDNLMVGDRVRYKKRGDESIELVYVESNMDGNALGEWRIQDANDGQGKRVYAKCVSGCMLPEHAALNEWQVLQPNGSFRKVPGFTVAVDDHVHLLEKKDRDRRVGAFASTSTVDSLKKAKMIIELVTDQHVLGQLVDKNSRNSRLVAKCFEIFGDFLRKDIMDGSPAFDTGAFRGKGRERRIREKEMEASAALGGDGLLTSMAALFVQMRAYVAVCMHAMRVVPCFFDAQYLNALPDGAVRVRELACYALLALPKLFLAKRQEKLPLSSTCSEDTIRCVSLVVRQSIISDPLWSRDGKIIPWFVYFVRNDIGMSETAILSAEFLREVVTMHADSTDAEVTQHIVAASKLLLEMLVRHYKTDDIRIHDMIFCIVKVLRTKRVVDGVSRIDATVPLMQVMHYYCFILEPLLVSASAAAWTTFIDSVTSIPTIQPNAKAFYARSLIGHLAQILVDLVSGWNDVDAADGRRTKAHKDMHLDAMLRCVVQPNMEQEAPQGDFPIPLTSLEDIVWEKQTTIPFVEVLKRVRQWAAKSGSWGGGRPSPSAALYPPTMEAAAAAPQGSPEERELCPTLDALIKELDDFEKYQKRAIFIKFTHFAGKYGYQTATAVFRLVNKVALMPIKAPIEMYAFLQESNTVKAAVGMVEETAAQSAALVNTSTVK